MTYQGKSISLLPRIAPLLIERLEKNDRVLFMGPPGMIEGIENYLNYVGFKPEQEIKKGTLILTSDRKHLKKGHFEAEEMLKLLSDAVDKALKDGFRGLWASGDMTWELGDHGSLKKLLEYEWGLEKLLQRKPALSGVWQYHESTLPLHIMGDALLTKPANYLNHTLHRVNPFYIPSETLDDPFLPPTERKDVQQMMKHIEET